MRFTCQVQSRQQSQRLKGRHRAPQMASRENKREQIWLSKVGRAPGSEIIARPEGEELQFRVIREEGNGASEFAVSDVELLQIWKRVQVRNLSAEVIAVHS